MNIRHDLDPKKVKDQIETKVRRLERQILLRTAEQKKLYAIYEQDVLEGRESKEWVRVPDTPESIEGLYRRWIEEEYAYYAKVRVIERLHESNERFLLVYGDVEDAHVTHGTGPFETKERAMQWFYNGGR